MKGDIENLKAEITNELEALEQVIFKKDREMQTLRDENIMLREKNEQYAAKNRQLEEELAIDETTGAFTMKVFKEKARTAFERAQSSKYGNFALLVTDINYFKPINDAFGYEFGNSTLMKVTSALKNSVRQEDVVARHSKAADEFFIILTRYGNRLDDIVARMQQAVKKIALPKPSRYVKLVPEQCSISIGYAQFSEGYKSVDEMIYAANFRMSEQKPEDSRKP